MTVFANTFRRLLRNKLTLMFMLVVPTLIIGFVYGLGNWGETDLTLGLVDLDQTPFTEMLRRSVAEKSQVSMLEESRIRQALANSSVNYVLVIQQGFTDEVIAGHRPALAGYSIQETNLAQPIKFNAESFLSAAAGIADLSAGDRDAFYQGMADYTEGRFDLDTIAYEDAGKSGEAVLSGMGLLAMTMMLLSSFTATALIQDRENRTFFRVLCAPVSLKSYMFQTILAFLAILLGQVTLLFLVLRYLFGLYLGASVLGLYGVMTVFALLCVSMGVALAALARSTQMAQTIATLFITPACMLGGLFWPRWMMPPFLQDIGSFLPTTWLMRTAEQVVLGRPFPAWGIAILFGYALVFFLLGTWRRTDVAR